MKILLIFFTFYLISAKVGMFRVSGYSGGGLMIKCEHPQYKTKPKYICKESDGCSERKSPGVQDEWMENGDVSLYDDTRTGVLMVFFRELKAADAGNIQVWSEYAKYPKSMTESANLGEEVSISCQIPEEHKVNFCKADDNHICQNISSSKVTQMNGSSERNEERVFTVSISNVSCVCDSAAIGGFTLTVWKLKHKRQDPGSVQMKSNDDLPTIPSDGLLYAAVSFQKHEESLSDAAVRFNPGSVQMNSHDDLPTIPSDGLLSAAVSFQKHEESLSDAAVRFSKDDIHCDYAAVSPRLRLN
ncbi:hypothetical protein QQF64_000206 [Cirrhinus molitorella]|uniref:Uncharacterized protein n=1 Tax=Cirrhinus molitorella TaxID=172907 RepID=A0ABR3NWH9_9TELE